MGLCCYVASTEVKGEAMVHIEQATTADIPQLADLLAILFTQEADFIPDREKQMRGLRLIVEVPERGQISVARIDGEIVGMVSLLFTVNSAHFTSAIRRRQPRLSPSCPSTSRPAPSCGVSSHGHQSPPCWPIVRRT